MGDMLIESKIGYVRREGMREQIYMMDLSARRRVCQARLIRYSCYSCLMHRALSRGVSPRAHAFSPVDIKDAFTKVLRDIGGALGISHGASGGASGGG